MSLYISIFTNIGISLVGILSIYVITGLTGLFSLGQAAFMAIGAYISGIVAINSGLPFIACAILGTLGAGFFGLLIGMPTIRLRRDYIALVTFGFGEAIIAVLNNLASITGGATGLIGIPKKTNFIIVLLSVIVITYFVWNFKKSRFGRQCLALKSDELAARSMGINVDRIKLTAFFIASMITGYAGVLYGFYTTYVDPAIFTWNKSAEWLIVLFFGGINSLTGALVSGIGLGALPEILRSVAEWRIIIYCVVVLIIINFRPQGIFGEWEFSLRKVWRFIKSKLSNKSSNPVKGFKEEAR